MPLSRRLIAEFTGTALLLACVVGYGIMGVVLSGGNAGTIIRTFLPPRFMRRTNE